MSLKVLYNATLQGGETPYLVCILGRDAILCRVSHLFTAYTRDSHALLCFSLFASLLSPTRLLASLASVTVHDYLSPAVPIFSSIPACFDC